MPLAKKIRVVKVPLSDKERLPDYPINFPPMPILYLELLENKAKIKQELVNKDYVPPKVMIDPNATKDNFNVEDDSDDEDSPKKSKSSESSESSDSSDSPRTEKINIDEDEKGKESDKEDDDDSDDSNLSDRLKELLGDESDSDNAPFSKSQSPNDKSPSKSSSSSSTDSSLSDRSIEKHNKKNKYSHAHKSPLEGITSYTPYKAALPPTLKELESKGQYQRKAEMRDMYNISLSEKEEEDKKRELLFKFEILRKSYKEHVDRIPTPTMHTPLGEMQRMYEDTIRSLTLDSNVSSYRMYLIGGFMVVEYVFGNFLGFDMHGFAKHQIVSMGSYEKLLIELGEKSYTPGGSKFPVELRLLFMIVVNAGFFIVGKMLMKKTGADLLGMINSSVTSSQAAPAASAPKRKMRGPNIKLNDLPSIDDEKYNVPDTEKQTEKQN